MLKKDSELLTCARCGKKNRWNESFCSACGSKIELTERPTIDLPRLSESVGKLELWGRNPSKAKPNRELEESGLISTSQSPKIEAISEPYAQESEEKTAEKQTRRNVSMPFGRCWREAWSKDYRVSPKRSICFLTLVLAELFMFFPYVLMVLCVFQYDACCAVLTISSAVVLLTHGICVGASYYSIFEQDKNRYDEIAKAADKTHGLLKLGATFISIFLLAFFICLSYNNAADPQSKPTDGYTPVSFDD